MIEYFKVVVFQKYATFSGRARRSEFWYYVLASFIISIIIGIVDSILGTNRMAGENGLLGGIYSLITFTPGIAVSARRLHDIGKPGWMLLILFIPLIIAGVIIAVIEQTGQDLMWAFGLMGLITIGIAIYYLILNVTEGDKGTNKYGPDPKNPEYLVEDHLID